MKRAPEAHPKRAAALQLLADGVTPAEVAARLEINPSTVRMWKSRAGKPARTDQPASKVATPASSGLTPAAELVEAQQTIDDARNAARMAIRRLHEVLPNARGPQAIAVAAGVMLDKAAQLEDRLAEQEDRRAMLLERDSAMIGDVVTDLIRHVLRAHGVDPSLPAVRRLVRELLVQAGGGGTMSVPEALADEAREAFRGELRRQVEADLRREAERPERLALPAPASSDDALRAWQQRARVDEEIVDGEVVSGCLLLVDSACAPWGVLLPGRSSSGRTAPSRRSSVVRGSTFPGRLSARFLSPRLGRSGASV